MNIKKRYYILGGISLIIFITLFFLSTIIKNYLVKHGEELVGRKLDLKELHINYFKVQVTARNFTLFEENKKDTFVYFKELLVNYDPWKMLSNEYAVSQIRLVNPYVSIKQNGTQFNFDDLVPPADTTIIEEKTDTLQIAENENVKFSIRNIDLQNGAFKYYDQQIDNLLNFDDLNLNLPLIAWDSQSSEMGVQFSIGKNGRVKVDAEINQQKSQYNVNFGTSNIQLNAFTNYLKDYMNIDSFNGLLQSDIKIKGSIEQPDQILVSGTVAIDSFSMVDLNGASMFSAHQLYTKLDSIDLEKSRYIINNISIDRPEISAILNKDKSNWESFFDPILSDTLNTANEDSIATSEPNPSPLYYRIDTVSVTNGLVAFTDNTLNREFSYNIKNIDIKLNAVTEQNNAIPVNWSMKFNNDGMFIGASHFSIKNPLNFFYDGAITDLDLHSFSPYTEYYLAYPIVSGLFNYDADIKMDPQKLENNNHLLVKEMQFGKKTKDPTASKLPVKLALYLIKDAQDNVEFELPVTGNPSEPGFKAGPVIWKTFGKFITKTATQPFSSLARLVGTQPEELEMVPFEYTQDSLSDNQRKVLDKIAEILTKKEELIFSFRQEVVMKEEMKQLAIKQVKNQYITETPSLKITNWKRVQDKDEKFKLYLAKLLPEENTLSVEEQCLKIVSKEELQLAFNDLYTKRNHLLKAYMIETKACNPASIKLLNVDFNNMPAELSNPEFRVEVSVK
ncbi:DUF748 domain-containing protein [Plebeiibacterium sediminum]|uniref:DUF748 domain-containing protein n=1 Tax=Plebeiibacterium sediminum TaxID=2992112 RepID=A0AAE3M811_9BACT|nr:DUF748 domain-containing protein [Plebeiobacterium sediminum]MCW3788954.1 DUF748 domain-containing protein [Plebeiobacterium sediminum]